MSLVNPKSGVISISSGSPRTGPENYFRSKCLTCFEQTLGGFVGVENVESGVYWVLLLVGAILMVFKSHKLQQRKGNPLIFVSL